MWCSPPSSVRQEQISEELEDVAEPSRLAACSRARPGPLERGRFGNKLTTKRAWKTPCGEFSKLGSLAWVPEVRGAAFDHVSFAG